MCLSTLTPLFIWKVSLTPPGLAQCSPGPALLPTTIGPRAQPGPGLPRDSPFPSPCSHSHLVNPPAITLQQVVSVVHLPPGYDSQGQEDHLFHLIISPAHKTAWYLVVDRTSFSLKAPQIRDGVFGSNPDVRPTRGEQTVLAVSFGQGWSWLQAPTGSSLRS